MAGDLNCVTLVGRLTRESEMRYSQNGGAIIRFSLAVNRRKRTGDKWEDEVNYFDCVYFGKSAEGINQYLEKGRQVAISGELRQNRWEQDGQARSRVEVFVNSLQLLSQAGRGENDSTSSFSRAPQQRSQQQSYSRTPAENTKQQSRDDIDYGIGPETYADDDVPF